MLSIGKLSAATGVKVPTIRYYEEIGLLPEAERSAGNHRLYGVKAQERRAFIRHSRELGFSLDDIRERGLRALVICPFILGWVRHHPEYQDLLFNAPPSTVSD